MHVRLNGENLEDLALGMDIVRGIAPGSSTLRILQNIKIAAQDNRLELSATNLELSAIYVIDSVEVVKPGAIAGPEARISSIIREWIGDSMEIKIEKDNICSITGKDSYFKVLCIDPDEFPSMPVFPIDGYIEIDKTILTNMIRKTAFISPSRRNLIFEGVLLEIQGDQAKMVATDGRRLAEITRKVNNLTDSNNLSCIIPLKTISQVLRIISKATDDVVKIKIDEKQIFLKAGNITLCSQLIQGQYLDYEAIIPSDLDKKIILDRDVFLHAIRNGSIMTTEQYKLLKFKVLNNNLELECISADVGESKINIPVKYSGQPVEIGLNPDYILDFLNVLETNKIILELKDDETGALFKAGINYRYLLMPIALE